MATTLYSRSAGFRWQERDYTVALKAAYGPLSTCFIETYTNSYGGILHRMRDGRLAGYYQLPIQDLDLFPAKVTDPFVYAATDKLAEKLLTERLITHPPLILTKRNREKYHHEHFLASSIASIELGAARKGYTFTHRRAGIIPTKIEFLGQKRGKHGWQDDHQTSGIGYEPDAFFELARQGKRQHFLEVDLGNERGWASDLDTKSWRSTLLKQIQLIETGKYKQLGVEGGALALNLFSDRAAMLRAQDELLNITDNKGKNYILFKTWLEFDDPTFIPKDVNYSLVDDAWYRVGHDAQGNPHAPFYL